jgi:hypothetical protein
VLLVHKHGVVEMLMLHGASWLGVRIRRAGWASGGAAASATDSSVCSSMGGGG